MNTGWTVVKVGQRCQGYSVGTNLTERTDVRAMVCRVSNGAEKGISKLGGLARQENSQGEANGETGEGIVPRDYKIGKLPGGIGKLPGGASKQKYQSVKGEKDRTGYAMVVHANSEITTDEGLIVEIEEGHNLDKTSYKLIIEEVGENLKSTSSSETGRTHGSHGDTRSECERLPLVTREPRQGLDNRQAERLENVTGHEYEEHLEEIIVDENEGDCVTVCKLFSLEWLCGADRGNGRRGGLGSTRREESRSLGVSGSSPA
jgi:hypothetical protein